MTDTPNLAEECLLPVNPDSLVPQSRSTHPPRILMLYGSLRERSYSRLAAEEGARVLERLGAEVRFFTPSGLPLVDDGVDASHPKVAELRELVTWSEGMVWSSPERHGAMTGLMKTQIDWIPLSIGAVRHQSAVAVAPGAGRIAIRSAPGRNCQRAEYRRRAPPSASADPRAATPPAPQSQLAICRAHRADRPCGKSSWSDAGRPETGPDRTSARDRVPARPDLRQSLRDKARLRGPAGRYA